jgi:ABC-type sugar transport system permease subunit
VFLLFVVYPIGYGFWTARHPHTYVHLVEDPIFARSLVNTIIFLIVAINIKMMIALVLSAFYSGADLDQSAVRDFHPALGSPFDSDDSVAALHA